MADDGPVIGAWRGVLRPSRRWTAARSAGCTFAVCSVIFELNPKVFDGAMSFSFFFIV